MAKEYISKFEDLYLKDEEARENYVSLATVAKTGSYTDLNNKPTKTSEFVNDGENGTTNVTVNTTQGPYTKDTTKSIVVGSVTLYATSMSPYTYVSSEGWVENNQGIRSYNANCSIAIINVPKDSTITFYHDRAVPTETYRNIINAQLIEYDNTVVRFKMTAIGTFKVEMRYGSSFPAYITSINFNTIVNRYVQDNELANVAKSGSYSDLSNKPTIPAAVAVKGNAESNYRTGNVNITSANIGLGNVGNFKAVSTVASQGLSDTEKTNARENIGAGTSSFSGNYNDLNNKPTVEISDDAAKANWGGAWRMPTKEEFLALGNAVNTEWEGNGLMCTDKDDSSKTLFFPVGGYCNDGTIYGRNSFGNYWCSSLTFDINSAYCMDCSNDITYWGTSESARKYGGVVRGVLDGLNANGHDYVEIGGIKWATMNVGANSINDYGLYFQWGDTQGYTADQIGSGEGKKYFGWEDYKYCNGTSSVMTKYNATDGLTILETSEPISNLHKVAVSGSYNDLNDKPTIPTAASVSWSALKALRDGGNLVAGQWYRITDYVTTTAQEDTQSAGHQFDIIVIADDNNKLNENAYAAIHSGDTYFANSKLEAWELKYCLDNDTDRFAWASSSGKGVIYWMKDEFFNECGYDFKNIMFARYKIIAMKKVPSLVNTYSGFRIVVTSGQGSLCPDNATIDSSDKVFRYTFDLNGADYSLTPRQYGCHGNVITPYKPSDNQVDRERQFLNNITFVNTSISPQCYGNKFKSRCHSMVFGNYCYYNTFGNYCYSNTFGNNCYSNTFGNYYYSNTFGDYCYYNTFGDYYRYNTFGNNCYSNTFGNNCYYNTFGDGCNCNTFGNYCYSNTFGNECDYNTFGNECNYNTFGNYCYSNTFGNDCYYNTFYTIRNLIFGNNNQVLFATNDIYQKKDNVFYPVSHPDLSTQPSILPQRFGNLPIKEVLIANGRENEIPKNAMVIEAWSFNNTQCTSAFVNHIDGVTGIKLVDLASKSINLPQCMDNLIVYGASFKTDDTINPENIKFVVDGVSYRVVMQGGRTAVCMINNNVLIAFYVDGNVWEFKHTDLSSTICTDILYNDVSIFKQWQITNSNNVTPDFTLVKYIEPEGGGYYGGY